MHLKSKSNGAVSIGIVAFVLVIIVVGAGAGAYLVFEQGPTSTSTSTSATSSERSYSSSQTTTSTATSSTTSSGTSPLQLTTMTTSSSTTQACLNLTGSGFNSFNNQSLFSASNLFGNFTQMAIHEEQIVNGSMSENANISYSLVGEPVINGTIYYQAEFTISLVSAQINSTQTVTIWFLPNGTATKLTTGATTAGGTYASLEALSFDLPFTLLVEVGSIFNQTVISSSAFAVVNSSSVMLGSITVNETVYNFSTQFLNEQNNNCGATSQQPFSELLLGIGQIENSNQTIAVLVYETFATGGSNYTIDLQVTNLTRA